MKTRCRAFTMLELLAVVAIVVVLAALCLSGFSALAQSDSVASAADIVRHSLDEARSEALTRNMPVEVRIYAVPSPSGGAPVYRALQLHRLNADGTTAAIAPPVWLPTWVVFDATAAHSTLIASNTQTPTPDAGDRRLNEQTRVFRFETDGTTDLNPASPWFVTVRSAVDSDPAHFPANWACVAVDATTGRTRVYRP